MNKINDSWSATILYNLAWLICSLLVIVDVLSIREASLAVITKIQANQVAASQVGELTKTQINTGFTLLALDEGMLFAGGIAAVVLAIAIEYYFRKGKEQGKLLKRILLVIGIQAAIFVVCVAIQTFV